MALMAPRAVWLTSLLFSILPSFVTDSLRPDHQNPKRGRLHQTSYLDGLRGIAALIVFICHYTEDYHGYFVPSHGLNSGKEQSSIIQLPFLRLVYSGRPMVHIFFVISGFALSYKPLKAIHAGDIGRCHVILASSTFRRPIRLFAPCVVSTFIILLLMQTGWLYEPLPTFSEQVADWSFAVFHAITWPWAWDFDLRPTYDIHLWTIPIEFVHSMLLFIVILALSPLRRGLRLGMVVGLMAYVLACGRWAAFLFLGGFLIAELQLIRNEPPSHIIRSHEKAPRSLGTGMGVLRTMFHVMLILPAWFIGGWPNQDAERTPGIGALLAWTPYPYSSMDERAPQKFWFSLSAVVVVWSLGRLRVMRRVLESSVSQYFGRISYAVYIVHGPVMNMVGYRLMGSVFVPAVGIPDTPQYKPAIRESGVKGFVGAEGQIQKMLAWLIGLFMLGPVVIWIADMFWRLIDIPIISAARRLEEWCTQK